MAGSVWLERVLAEQVKLRPAARIGCSLGPSWDAGPRAPADGLGR